MRYTRMRFDIWLCLLLAFAVSLGAVKLTELVLPGLYQRHVEEHTVADGDIGGKAGPEVFRVQSVDDILSHDTFTIVSHGIEYRNRGAGYYDGIYTYGVTLPSGEVVAARINMENVQQDGDYYTSDHTLPVGKVVYADLTESKMFMDQISYGPPLTRTDFYVDMLGVGGKMPEEDYNQRYTGAAQVIAIFVCFPIFHWLGSSLGLFPRFFPPRRRKGEEEAPKSEWD